MGMGGSKSAPDIPDLNQTIGSQVGGNIGMTKYNNCGDAVRHLVALRHDQSGTRSRNDAGKVKKTTYTDPYTGEKYKTPLWEQNIKLSPEEQQKYDLSNQAQIGALGKANDLMGSMGNFNPSIYQPGADLSGEAWTRRSAQARQRGDRGAALRVLAASGSTRASPARATRSRRN